MERYPARSRQAAVIQLMIMNNLDPRVAQFPHELVSYGANGQVFSNWAQVQYLAIDWCMSSTTQWTMCSAFAEQFWLVMKYLSDMDEEQTLVLCSGHPQGLFPSGRHAPRVVVTNGMVSAHIY